MTESVPQRSLGRTELKVSEIGLGCWQLGTEWGPIDDDRAEQILSAATEQGVTFWDTADVYGGGLSEQRIGRYLAQHPNPDRVVATKIGRTPELYPDGYQRDRLRAAIESNRERLQVDRIDLVQLHCIPMQELQRGRVFEWLEECRQDGLIRHYGASVETVEQAQYCLDHTEVASLQLILNVLRQDMATEVLPKARERGVGIIVRLALASGLLSAKMSREQTFAETDHRRFNRDGEAFFVGETFAGLPFELGVDRVEALKALLPAGLTVPQVALRWLLDQPAVSSVITGASRPDQITRNAAASQLPPLDETTRTTLANFYRNEVRPHIRGAI